MAETPGHVDGVHYTEHVEQIQALKRAGRTEDAIALLLKCVDATEEEDRLGSPIVIDEDEEGNDVFMADESGAIILEGQGLGVAPFYYEQLAILYRKAKRFDDEVAILERYAAQNKSPGATGEKLMERLRKIR